MPEVWQFPVDRPILTDALVDELVREARESGRKPKAFPTAFRFSDAGACSRVLAYGARGIEPSDEMDAAALWVVERGSAFHERIQEAIRRRYPTAVIEPKGRIGDLASGSADAVATIAGVRCLWELKTVGAYAFDKAVGLRRSAYQVRTPEGPRRSALLQGALNATAHDCDVVIIGYLAMEAVSIPLAQRIGWNDIARIVAEWHVPKEVWEPMARAEIGRQQEVLEIVSSGAMPAAVAIGDSGRPEPLTPLVEKPPWQCSYCKHKSRCIADLQGIDAAPGAESSANDRGVP